MKINSIKDVVERQLCTGCGACAYLERGRFRMANSLEFGLRPITKPNARAETFEGLEACPGLTLDRNLLKQKPDCSDFLAEWGPVLGVWEAAATDADIQFAGSSGGVISAIALYCLEARQMEGAVHTAAKESAPYLNETVFSKSREELVSRAGSRYGPASPVEGLRLIENSPGPFIFIGKPCDAAAVYKIRDSRAEINDRLGLVMSFFCAGVPSTQGTLELMRTCGINNPSNTTALRYRGHGWPGNWVAEFRDEDDDQRSVSLSYEASWGYLEKFRQWRCYICPDHSGEFSDIAVGDPWYREIETGESGSSLLVARTQLGYDVIQAAREAGYITLDKEDVSLLPRSQPNLLKSRSALWGRLLALGIMDAAVPNYSGFNLFDSWLNELSMLEKIRSIAGTIKRTIRRKLRKRVPVTEWLP